MTHDPARRIAFLTMVLLKAPRADARVAGFMERIEGAFAQAQNATGFVDRARVDPVTGLYNWGTRGVPGTFHEREPGDRLVHTLSLWRDVKSVAAYAYRGLHREALRGAREWCVEPAWPSYCAWWVADDVTPTWAEAYERFDLIHRQGSTPAAFDFRVPYSADGLPLRLASL